MDERTPAPPSRFGRSTPAPLNSSDTICIACQQVHTRGLPCPLARATAADLASDAYVANAVREYAQARMDLFLADVQDFASRRVIPYEWQRDGNQLDGRGSRCAECHHVWLAGKEPVHAESCIVGRILRDVKFVENNFPTEIPPERRSASASPETSPAADVRPSLAASLNRYAEPWAVNAPGVAGHSFRVILDAGERVLFDFKHSNLCANEQEAIAQRVVTLINGAAGIDRPYVMETAE